MSSPYSWPRMPFRALNPRVVEVLPGHRSPRLRFWVNQLLILPPYVEPHSGRALSGTGTSTMSRGTWNIATCFVTGSTETTISVSVLNVASPGRVSAPTRSTLSRSLPSHGGSVGASVPDAPGSGVGTVSVGDGAAATADGSGVSVGWADAPGDGVSDGSLQSAAPSSLNTQLTRSSARTLYRATARWPAPITSSTAIRPADDTGLIGSLVRPARPSPDASPAVRKGETCQASTAAMTRYTSARTLPTKMAVRTPGSMSVPSSSARSARSAIPPRSAIRSSGSAAKASARVHAPA